MPGHGLLAKIGKKTLEVLGSIEQGRRKNFLESKPLLLNGRSVFSQTQVRHGTPFLTLGEMISEISGFVTANSILVTRVNDIDLNGLRGLVNNGEIRKPRPNPRRLESRLVVP
jgi:hypothetical protein